MNVTVRGVRAQSREFERLKDWRSSYIGENPANEPDFAFWESVRDNCSYTFAFYQQDQLVGGVRLTPLGHGVTMAERQLNLGGLLPRDALEVNRLVIDEGFRGRGVMSEALVTCFRWAKHNTTHAHLVAVCVPRMVPLYERVGATLLATDIPCPSVQEKKYALINLKLENLL